MRTSSSEIQEVFDEVAEGIKKSSPALSEALFKLFEELQEAGFSEEQAFELVKNDPLSLTVSER